MAASQPGPGLKVAIAGTRKPIDGSPAGGPVNPPSTHQLHSSFTIAAGALAGKAARSAALTSEQPIASAMMETLASSTRFRAVGTSGVLMAMTLPDPSLVKGGLRDRRNDQARGIRIDGLAAPIDVPPASQEEAFDEIGKIRRCISGRRLDHPRGNSRKL
jgi:hypothetical protein